jgi:hypothetical protein
MPEIVNFNTTASDRKKDQPGSSTKEKVDRYYSGDEVSEIIRLALKGVDYEASNSVDHQELMTIGKEFGLCEEEINTAYEKLQDQRDTSELKELLGIQLKMVGFLMFAIALLLFAIDFFFYPEESFAQFALPGLMMAIIVCGLQFRYFPKLASSIFATSSKLETGSVASFSTRRLVIYRKAIGDYRGRYIEKGLVRVEDDYLLMEYRRYDILIWNKKSEIEEMKIPLAEIIGVQLERKFWMSKLVLKARSLKTFDNVPGESSGSLHLTFYPRARISARNLTKEIERYIRD